jgi:hypothetical protein
MWKDDTLIIPEESFIKVSKPFNFRMKIWVIEHIYERKWVANRWDQCRMEGCFIVLCQVHNYENSWVKDQNKN